jgi:predicted nucleic acid-binding protein
MSVIVDTTIWSKYFRRKFHEKNTEIIDEMSKLIETQKVVIIGPIRQELLSGISNKNIFTKLKAKMRAFIDYKVKTADYELAAEYYNSCMKNGIQGSVTDLLICAVSVRNKFEIFTEDGDFPKYKKYLPIKIYRKLA